MLTTVVVGFSTLLYSRFWGMVCTIHKVYTLVSLDLSVTFHCSLKSQPSNEPALSSVDDSGRAEPGLRALRDSGAEGMPTAFSGKKPRQDWERRESVNSTL